MRLESVQMDCNLIFISLFQNQIGNGEPGPEKKIEEIRSKSD